MPDSSELSGFSLNLTSTEGSQHPMSIKNAKPEIKVMRKPQKFFLLWQTAAKEWWIWCRMLRPLDKSSMTLKKKGIPYRLLDRKIKYYGVFWRITSSMLGWGTTTKKNQKRVGNRRSWCEFWSIWSVLQWNFPIRFWLFFVLALFPQSMVHLCFSFYLIWVHLFNCREYVIYVFITRNMLKCVGRFSTC